MTQPSRADRLEARRWADIVAQQDRTRLWDSSRPMLLRLLGEFGFRTVVIELARLADEVERRSR